MAKRRMRKQKEALAVKWQFSSPVEAKKNDNTEVKNTDFSEGSYSISIIKKGILKSLALASLIFTTEIVLYLIRI